MNCLAHPLQQQMSGHGLLKSQPWHNVLQATLRGWPNRKPRDPKLVPFFGRWNKMSAVDGCILQFRNNGCH